MRSIQKICAAAVTIATAAAAVSGCGSSSSSSAAAGASGGSGAGASTSASTGSGGSGGSTSSSGGAGAPAPLSAEGRSLATGDIPDNQVFLVLTNSRGGYSMKYPEGWTLQGSGANVTIRNKNNLVHIVISHGSSPSVALVASQLNALKKTTPSLTFTAPQQIPIGSSQAVKAVYTTQSAANPVTGKRVTLIVDRYELSRNGRLAVVDLGTPTGVDNVDAYRKMIQSFTWR
jgi:hypothetical protein